MTKEQYRAALKKLELTQVAAAEFLGISSRCSQGYAIGEYPVQTAAAKLLRTMLKYKLDTKDVPGE